MKYIKLVITRTSKPLFSQENYTIFDEGMKTFDSLEQARTFLANEYEGHKRVKMYCDTIKGESKHIGWIYCLKNKDWSHNSEWWLQQDWIDIREVEEKRVII